MQTYIRDLRPRDRDKIIEAKVYRSWMARDPPAVEEKGYLAILLDKHVFTNSEKKEFEITLFIPMVIITSFV